MTVSYGGNFVRLLFYWKGSVWKAVWKELLIWLLLYYAVRLVFEYGFGKGSELAADIVKLFTEFTNELPIEFMLGFYVSQIINRWWTQILLVPWPDDAMSLVNASLFGTDSETRLKRHTIARYLVLCEILALRKISIRVRKRFPTVDHVINSGLMTKEESQAYHNTTNEHVRWQLPLSWAQNLIVPLVGIDHGNISPVVAVSIYQEFNKYRASLRNVLTYDWICIPLVYTQAVGVGLYGYFGLCLLGRQFFGKPLDAYVPFLTVLKFVFYVGWFKVAQDLMRPFGEDDDDVELNYLIERHLQVAMAMADQASEQSIPTSNDKFYTSKSIRLPHTKLSAKVQDRPPTAHATLSDVTESDLLEFTPIVEPPMLKEPFRKSTEELLQF